MLLATKLTLSLLQASGDIFKAMDPLNLEALLAHGFPGELMDDGGDRPGAIKCICLGSGAKQSRYAADLLDAFDDYERFADTREMPSGGKLLSPVFPAVHYLAAFRIAAYPEERHLLTHGNLPLPCPECGRIVHAVGRGPVSSMAEYFEYDCCHPFYYLRPFREWAFDKSVYDPVANILYHHGHNYARREFLVRTFESFRQNLAVCVQKILQGGAIREPESLNDTIPVLIGRGEFNPGHIIFEDLAGIFLLCEAMETCRIPGKLDVLVSEKAKWFEPLLGILPAHRVARVTTVPSDMARITSLLCRKGLALVNPKVHPCWPHTLNGCGYLKQMCQRIRALADRNGPGACKDAMRVVFPLRVHNRCWEPLFENVQQVIKHIRAYYGDVRFILHAVGAEDPAYFPFRETAEKHDDVELLFDAQLVEVLSQFCVADLCIGPIGSGFWWAGLFGVPSVTIHPKNKPDTVELGEWILPPSEGLNPPFLTLEPDQRCVVVEEKNADREAYGALSLPVDRVLGAVDEILRPNKCAPLDSILKDI